jgi:hypothetical protein
MSARDTLESASRVFPELVLSADQKNVVVVASYRHRGDGFGLFRKHLGVKRCLPLASKIKSAPWKVAFQKLLNSIRPMTSSIGAVFPVSRTERFASETRKTPALEASRPRSIGRGHRELSVTSYKEALLTYSWPMEGHGIPLECVQL